MLRLKAQCFRRLFRLLSCSLAFLLSLTAVTPYIALGQSRRSNSATAKPKAETAASNDSTPASSIASKPVSTHSDKENRPSQTGPEPQNQSAPSKDAQNKSKPKVDRAIPGPLADNSAVFKPDPNQVAQNTIQPKPDEATGSLTDRYPITIPPGRNGLQPDLQLEYNSQNTAQDSPVGYGWSLNIPYIQRLNKTGTDRLYADNYFTSSLSGELVSIFGSSYAPKAEPGTFLKYSFNGTAWTVTDKKGTTYTFGLTSQSRQDNPDNAAQVSKWMLEEILDTNNNNVSYTYSKDQGQIYPATISYTGNGSQSGAFQVRFSLDSRNDAVTSYETGFLVKTSYRINTVNILEQGIVRCHYALNYITGDNGVRSLLQSATETGYDVTGTTVSKTTKFDYTKNTQSSVPTNPDGTVGLNWTTSNSGYTSFLTEGCVIATSNGANPQIIADCGLRVADLNGDGLPDYISAYSAVDQFGTPTLNYSESVSVYLNNGHGFTKTSWELPLDTALHDYYGSQLVLYNTTYPHLVFTSSSPSPGAGNPSTSLQLIDVNGDGRADLVWQDVPRGQGSLRVECSSNPWKVYLNNGSGWDYTPTYITPIINTNGGPCNVNLQTQSVLNFADVNNDGFPDFVVMANDGFSGGIVYATFLNNHINGWSDASGSWPINLTGAPTDWAPQFGSNVDFTRLVDVNNDSLPDILVTVRDTHPFNNGSIVYPSKPGQFIYLLRNVGHGWVYDPTFKTPSQVRAPGKVSYPASDPYRVTWHENDLDNFNIPPTTRYNQVLDINGDGLPDLLAEGTEVYLSDGTQWVDSPFYSSALQRYLTTPSSLGFIPSSSPFGNNAYEALIPMDVDGDGVIDLVRGTRPGSGSGPQPQFPWPVLGFLSIKTNRPTYSLPLRYQTVAQLRPLINRQRSTSAPMGPCSMPICLSFCRRLLKLREMTVMAMQAVRVIFMPMDTYFFDQTTPLDRKFAGFGTIAKTDSSGNVTSNFFHLGNGSDTAKGEFNDSYAKIGRVYRTEIIDAQNKKFASTINRWDQADQGGGSSFVFLSQSASQTFDTTTLTPQAPHRDTATAFTYNSSNGNLLTKTDYGEVQANDDGSFSDIGNDTVVTTDSYAQGGSSNNQFAVSSEVVSDGNGTKFKETKIFYDNLGFGQLSIGNPTNQQSWISGNKSATTAKTYNSYGLVTSETDANGNATHFAYDSFNLYPATVTNALNQQTQFEYNYACGKPSKITDPNGSVGEMTFDGLCRLTKQEVSDPSVTGPASQSPLVVKTSYQYTDTPNSVSIDHTDYLSANLTSDTISYFDGLGRPIQARKSSATPGRYIVTDTVYDSEGRVSKQSLPYFGAGVARGSATPAAALYTTLAYDALDRVTSATTVVGVTQNVYSLWTTTTTDARGDTKDYLHDARNRLVQVNENNGGNTYATKYTYDPVGNLINIADAEGNVRNFSYDGLSRRTAAEDLHAPGDNAFGIYLDAYDDQGNLTQRIDPNGNFITNHYDLLNRLTTVDVNGQLARETYSYDTCPNGAGRLCTATRDTNSMTSYEYNSTGIPNKETKVISTGAGSSALLRRTKKASKHSFIEGPALQPRLLSTGKAICFSTQTLMAQWSSMRITRQDC